MWDGGENLGAESKAGEREESGNQFAQITFPPPGEEVIRRPVHSGVGDWQIRGLCRKL